MTDDELKDIAENEDETTETVEEVTESTEEPTTKPKPAPIKVKSVQPSRVVECGNVKGAEHMVSEINRYFHNRDDGSATVTQNGATITVKARQITEDFDKWLNRFSVVKTVSEQ